jgi:hypothetical protein
VVLLFADTGIEDRDTYAFLDAASVDLGVPITRLADGRDPWEVFFDVRLMGNTRADPCSRILKRDLIWAYTREHFDPADSVIYLGIDWTETHRLEGVRRRQPDWTIEGPMCGPPYLSKRDMLDWADDHGLPRQRLYEMGFPHANCGGFCIKAGQAHFELLLRKLPERYAHHEAQEQRFRAFIGKDVAILRDRTGGQTRPLTLREFRERVQGSAQPGLFDPDEWGGCGCMVGGA